MRHITVHGSRTPYSQPTHRTTLCPPHHFCCCRRCCAADGTTPYVSAYSTFAAMYYEFYILQTAPLSSTTRDPSRYSEARDKGRGVGLYPGEMERKATRLRIREGDLLEIFESRK